MSSTQFNFLFIFLVDLESGDSDPIPEMSAAEEFEEERSWKSCVINGEERNIDMKVIEPYRKVLSHGGIMFYISSDDINFIEYI